MFRLTTLIAPAALILMAAAPLHAQSLRVENRIDVVGVPGGFEVQSGGGYGARGMWCAAARYADRVLGASGTSRVYIARPRTAADRRAPVVFTTDPGGLTPVGVLSLGRSLGTAGANLSVDHAQGFCADFRLTSRN